MTVVYTVSELARALSGAAGQDIRFVPTMGALHEGHLSLVRAAMRGRGADGVSVDASRDCGTAAKSERGTAANGGRGMVVVSVFVNPTQFNDPADLRNYPRTPERDLELLSAVGADVVFMPSVEEIYPTSDACGCGSQCRFDFGELDKVMEGATRPGHFNGVAQVVSRLFELVKPTVAFFGQKDFQQVAIIREMVRQARLAGEPWAGVEIVECPTVREDDGLAMSSRNALLTPEHRAAAPDIYRALRLGALKAAELSRRELEKFVRAEVEKSGLLKVIYFDFMGPRACIAVQAGNIRLIDNMRYDD